MRIEDVRSPLRAVLFSLIVGIVGLASTASAQEWRGQGRVAGKITDEAGKPLEGVTITATMPASQNRGPAAQKTNAKGDWSIGGIAGGSWVLEFAKEGYVTRTITVPVSEGMRLPPGTFVLEKAVVVVDPNDVIKERLTVAAGMMNARQFAEARAIYEALAAQYPAVKQFKPLLARAHHGEGNTDKAIEVLKEAVAADPADVDVQVLLGTILIESGRMAEGQAVLSAVDASKITDPTVFVNIGISLINDKKPADAIIWLTKGVTTFPNDPSAYYYRGISHLSLGDTASAKTDLTKFVSIAPADASELPTAKKILETIK
ncbi:MAG: tetratricopeptide repeat protein [Acidimicrobiia bacterium]|nr:tetratricopeptide repeat protein [Acidimicrobiia bacterium]